MNSTLYTMIDHNGDILGRGLTIAEAAQEILWHDGRDFEIREGEEFEGILKGQRRYELWSRQQVANVKWGRTMISAIAATKEEAEAEIFAEVVAARWERRPQAIPDADYDRIVAEAEE